MIHLLVILVGLAALTSANPVAEPPLWEDCGTNPNRPFVVSQFSVSPLPVQIPGSVNISFVAQNKREIPRLKLQVEVKRHIWDQYYATIPCFREQGSCTYNDLCQYINVTHFSSEDLMKKVQDLFHTAGTELECPLKAATLNLQNYHTSLPKVPSFLTKMAVGKYKITVKFLVPETDEELGCFRLNIEAVEEVEEEDSEEDCWFWC